LDGIDREEDVTIADLALLFFRFDRFRGLEMPITLDRKGELVIAEVLLRRGNLDAFCDGEAVIPCVAFEDDRLVLEN